jgi:hypothetical protein
MKWIIAAITLTSFALYFFWPDTPKKTRFVASDTSFSFVNSNIIRSTVIPSAPQIAPPSLLISNAITPTAIQEPLKANNTQVELSTEYHLAQFTTILLQHLKQGVSLAELTQAYKNAKAKNWPVDWIFIKEDANQSYALNEVVDLRTYSYYKQNIFTLNITLDPLPKTDRILQQKNFQQQLKDCNACIDKSLLFEFLIHQGPRLLPGVESLLSLKEYNDTIASNLAIPLAMGKLIDLRITNNEPFNQEKLNAANALKNSKNMYLINIGLRAEAILEKNEAALAKLITDEGAYSFRDYFKIAQLSLVLSHQDIYSELNRRLEHEVPTSDLNLILDTINFHAQYYSINSALSSLNTLKKQHNIGHHPIWRSLNNAINEGFNTLADKWNFEAKQQSRLYDGVFNKKGQAINQAKLNLMLINKLATNNNLEKTMTRWRKAFQSNEMADEIFSQLNWSLLTPRGFPQDGILVDDNIWLKNITTLYKNNQNTVFDTVSTQHWQLVGEIIGMNFLKIKPNHHSKKIINGILDIYPKLLPSEKEWVDAVLIENKQL